MLQPRTLVSKPDLEDFLSRFDNFVLDLDGTVWRGEHLIDGTKTTLEMLRKRGKKLAFLTNNAVLSRGEYAKKFHRLEIPLADPAEIVTSGSASAHFLKEKLLPTLPEKSRRIFVIGQRGLEEELKELELDFIGGTDPALNEPMPLQDFTSLEHDPTIGVVLHSFDMHLNYNKISRAFNHLASNPAHLVITNDDLVCVAEGKAKGSKVFAAGEGATAAALKTATTQNYITVVGKPNAPLIHAILEKNGFDPSKTCLIGDNLATDIAAAHNGGISSLLVLTGSSNLHDLEKLHAPHPHFVTESLGTFAQLA